MNIFSNSPIIKSLSSIHNTSFETLCPNEKQIVFNSENKNIIGMSWYYEDKKPEEIHMKTSEYSSYYSTNPDYFRYDQIKRISTLNPEIISKNELFFLFFTINPMKNKNGYSNISITLETDKNVHVIYFFE